jgi:hypothetical protein
MARAFPITTFELMLGAELLRGSVEVAGESLDRAEILSLNRREAA